ncbi:uncharacterized protein JCM10292_005260 [Rhodotorula paludigena]|uniref:uncharacterized protein n=1 Tax=Rhodotorula paludigena TaxID=86838 RepID=UPI00317CB3D9
MVSDRTTGGCLLVLLTVAFVYYTLWTLVTPFFPPASPLLVLFPLSREWAIRLPSLILLVGLSFVGLLTGGVLIETAKRKRASTMGGPRESQREKGD